MEKITNYSYKKQEKNYLINKKIIYKLIIILITALLLFPENSFAETSNIGKIDLSLALVLHPRMTLFDYNRLGFYKMPFVLSDNDFYKEKSKISMDDSEKNNQILNVKQKIKELSLELSNNLKEADKIKKIESDISKLKKELENLEFEIDNLDITEIEETKKIISEISDEIFNTIGEIAKEQNLNSIINDYKYTYNSFPNEFLNRTAFDKNPISLSNNYYYIFMSDSLNSTETDLPSSVYLSNWLENTRYPDVIDALPLKTQSLVISGAKDILPDVIKKVYSKYKIPSDTTERILKVISSI